MRSYELFLKLGSVLRGFTVFCDIYIKICHKNQEMPCKLHLFPGYIIILKYGKDAMDVNILRHPLKS